jgi:cell division septum initiation protein DivIVA
MSSARATRSVAQIIAAAEQAAEELRLETEARARERIAEADRAAAARVEAAEAEAAELLADAQRQAAALHETASSDAARIKSEAKREAKSLLDTARAEASETQRIAEVFATETRSKAEADASKQIKRARDLAAEVLGDGTEMSAHLRQLSDSLRRNAETLLNDVTLAHRSLSSRLDDLDPGDNVRTLPPAASPDFGDVPEFIPRTPRKRAR